ncbi:MAG: hypothetical protein ACRBFS_27445 [Aureispira sp.]
MNKFLLFYLFSLLLLTISFQSCTKEEPTPDPVPTSFEISRIILFEYPPLNANGNDWDTGNFTESKPDCYFTLYDKASIPPTLPRITDTRDNVTNIITQTHFDLSSPYKINALDNTWVLRLYDEDFNGEEFMTEIEFVPNNYTPNLPIQIDQGQLRLTIQGIWSFI